jgi:hypothetical protein
LCPRRCSGTPAPRQTTPAPRCAFAETTFGWCSARFGFQLTLQRPASGLTTPYAGRVTLQTAGEGEDLPVVIQGFWSEVEPSVIAALPTGPWRVVLTNARVGSAGPVGDALVDEVRVVAR